MSNDLPEWLTSAIAGLRETVGEQRDLEQIDVQYIEIDEINAYASVGAGQGRRIAVTLGLFRYLTFYIGFATVFRDPFRRWVGPRVAAKPKQLLEAGAAIEFMTAHAIEFAESDDCSDQLFSLAADLGRSRVPNPGVFDSFWSDEDDLVANIVRQYAVRFVLGHEFAHHSLGHLDNAHRTSTGGQQPAGLTIDNEVLWAYPGIVNDSIVCEYEADSESWLWIATPNSSGDAQEDSYWQSVFAVWGSSAALAGLSIAALAGGDTLPQASTQGPTHPTFSNRLAQLITLSQLSATASPYEPVRISGAERTFDGSAYAVALIEIAAAAFIREAARHTTA